MNIKSFTGKLSFSQENGIHIQLSCSCQSVVHSQRLVTLTTKSCFLLYLTVDCSAGYYSTNGTSSMCTPCEMNTYQDTPGQASCKPCSANTYSNITASTSSSNCISKKISYSKISLAIPVNLYILIICLIIVHLLVFLLSFIYSINHTNNCFSKVILIRFGDG